MYQALYRKWRPKVFSDVIGQEHITETLKKQVAEGRTSHAYLFTGTRGTGKTTCAKILAKAVNCEHPVNGDPCCQCPSCLGIENGSFLDVLELDAASNNGVDQVRALRDEAIYSPANVRKRVYIVDEVAVFRHHAAHAAGRDNTRTAAELLLDVGDDAGQRTDIAAHRALRERIARAARGKAAKRALFFEHERALAAEGRVCEQQFVQFTGVERCIPRRRARGIPQAQNLRRVRALIQTKPHKTLRISQKGCCVSQQPFVEIFCQPLTAPIVTPSRKYFCNVKNRMNIGSAESVAPAIMGAKSVSFANLKVLRPTWIVNI